MAIIGRNPAWTLALIFLAISNPSTASTRHNPFLQHRAPFVPRYSQRYNTFRSRHSYIVGRGGASKVDGGDAHAAADASSLSTARSYAVSAYSVKGARPYMEDEYIHNNGGKFAGVFDGHGGGAVSKYLRQNLYACLQAALPTAAAADAANTTGSTTVDASSASSKIISTSPSLGACIQALTMAFNKVDDEVQRISHWSFQGSTAVSVLLHEEYAENDGVVKRTLISANVGDSRAILCRRGRAIQLTRDHKPNDPLERQRIEARGGKVEWCGMIDSDGKPLQDTGVYRINGNLAVSRAIGDRSERPCVSSEVDIATHTMDNDGSDEFVLLASDGLWDVMGNDEVVEFVHGMLREDRSLEDNIEDTGGDSMESRMAELVVREALLRGSTDNVSVLIIWLK